MPTSVPERAASTFTAALSNKASLNRSSCPNQKVFKDMLESPQRESCQAATVVEALQGKQECGDVHWGCSELHDVLLL